MCKSQWAFGVLQYKAVKNGNCSCAWFLGERIIPEYIEIEIDSCASKVWSQYPWKCNVRAIVCELQSSSHKEATILRFYQDNGYNVKFATVIACWILYLRETYDSYPPSPFHHAFPRARLHVVGMLRYLSVTLTNRACPLLFYSVLVSISVSEALSTVFHSINSPDNSPFSHSVLLVLSLPNWSFQLYVSLWKPPSALI